MVGSARAGNAFGLRLQADFTIPGLAGDDPTDSLPVTELRLASADELEPGEGSDLLYADPLDERRLTIHDADHCFVLAHPLYGRFRVTRDGSRVNCAPGEMAEWRWQRFLLGQVLPLASVLRGYEPLHGSAVAVGGRALLVLGVSGAGKTSLALHMAAAGARFMADDVAALELAADGVLVHPAPAVASVDVREFARLPGAVTERWHRLGSAEGEYRIELTDDAVREAAPLGWLFVVTRTDAAGEIEIGQPEEGRLQTLLGGTFNAYIRNPARLERQFAIAGQAVAAAPLHVVRAPAGASAAEVADALIAAV